MMYPHSAPWRTVATPLTADLADALFLNVLSFTLLFQGHFPLHPPLFCFHFDPHRSCIVPFHVPSVGSFLFPVDRFPAFLSSNPDAGCHLRRTPLFSAKPVWLSDLCFLNLFVSTHLLWSDTTDTSESTPTNRFYKEGEGRDRERHLGRPNPPTTNSFTSKTQNSAMKHM